MRNKKAVAFIFLFSSIILLNGFIEDNPYFKITSDDVVLKIPKRFPKPVYDLKENKITPEGFVLGRKLFYDPVLSRDSSTSCAFCHQRFAAFAHIDHTLSHGINGLIGKRNVPAIQNMIWQNSFMWDGGVNHLDLQPVAPIQNPVEMDETLDHVVKKLQSNAEYRSMFDSAFHDSVITSKKMLQAISQFIMLMVSSDSKYDKVERGEEEFNGQELNGLKIFRSRCANCHKEPLFTDNSFRNNGLERDTSLNDSGRYAITGLQSDYLKFKVPSLRNVEMTYPYMHDGRFKSLQQVLNYYAEGKFHGDNLDKSVNRAIGLSESEKVDVIAFLKTLTDKTFLYDRRFADPFFK